VGQAGVSGQNANIACYWSRVVSVKRRFVRPVGSALSKGALIERYPANLAELHMVCDGRSLNGPLRQKRLLTPGSNITVRLSIGVQI
jgi:hypothetical protein